ncbi:MAG: glycosyltransferase, partial [Patescibacteria group bacterium]|nr:glycosyltransferase [Patescibacteria group bacterium]
LAQMYPDADIYTLVYNHKKFDKYLSARNIKTSRLQNFPGFIKSRPKLLLPFIKGAINKWEFSNYDLVITSSSAWVKNINVPKETKHICYCYSPARMLWDSWPRYVMKQKLGPVTKFYIVKLASSLRLWDYYQYQNDIKFIAISDHVKSRIAKFYHRESVVIYPPVELANFKSEPLPKKDFYLIVSILAQYKNIELAIEAFRSSGKKLVIAGDGPDMQRLQSVAKGTSNITFLGRVDEAKKIELMASAKGFIFCNIEDFGITMVESIASGTGVIALQGGGANEIIKQNSTGVFFIKPDEESLNKAIIDFEKTILSGKHFNNQYIFDKFSVDKFERDFRKVVNAK